MGGNPERDRGENSADGLPGKRRANFPNTALILLSQKKRLIQKVAGEVLSESVTG
jgi:hypothetical protein